MVSGVVSGVERFKDKMSVRNGISPILKFRRHKSKAAGKENKIIFIKQIRKLFQKYREHPVQTATSLRWAAQSHTVTVLAGSAAECAVTSNNRLHLYFVFHCSHG